MRWPLLIVCFTLCVGESLQKTSPCPSVFVYDERDDSADTWFGTIRLKSNVPLYGVFVDIVFSSPVAGFGTFLQQHHTDDSVVFHVTDKTYQVRAGEIVTIKFYVRYATDRPVPLLQKIRFNGQNICSRSTPASAVRENANKSRDQTGTGVSSASARARETETGTEYSHAVQPILPQLPGEQAYRQEKQNSSTHGPVATRETVPQPVYSASAPAYSGDSFPTSLRFEEHADHTSHAIPEDGSERNEGHGHVGRRLVSTTSRPLGTTTRPTLRSLPTVSEQLHPRVPLNADESFGNHGRSTTKSPGSGGGHKEEDRFFAGDFAFIRPEGSRESGSGPHYISEEGDICGTVVPKANPLVTHGALSDSGQFPWHGALYRSVVTQLKYLCGATLISRRASVTAAHCVTLANTNRPVDVDSLLVYFGKLELDRWNGPEQDAKISSIHLPAEYNHERFYQDIALLLLKDDVKYGSAVRPICLWNYDTDYKALIGKVGLIPGWGYTDRGLVSSRLSYAQMPVVSHETCIWSNRNFFSRVTSDTSFCAGFKNGTSVCNGDSGGGMVFKISNRWYLRGIVSVSAALQDLLRCNVEHYVVFTDVAKFGTWIKGIVEKNGLQLI